MPCSKVVNTKSKQCVQVAAEDGKDDVQQQETTSANKKVVPEDKDKKEGCDLGDDTTEFLTGTTDDISLTQKLSDDASTDNSVFSESTFSTANHSREEVNVISPKQVVSRFEIPSAKITAIHICKLFPSNRNKLTGDMIQQKIKEISDRKSDALVYFGNFI